MPPPPFARTRPDAPRLDSDSPLSSSPPERPAPLKAKRSHRKADPDAAHRYMSTQPQKLMWRQYKNAPRNL